jgi:hypothetical protein
LAEISAALLDLLRYRRFLLLTLTLSFGQSSLYAYLGASSWVFLTKFALEPWQYSVVFAITATGWAPTLLPGTSVNVPEAAVFSHFLWYKRPAASGRIAPYPALLRVF